MLPKKMRGFLAIRPIQKWMGSIKYKEVVNKSKNFNIFLENHNFFVDAKYEINS